MTDRELLQQALDALETADSRDGYRSYSIEIQAIRTRLAQPEPPIWNSITCSCGRKWCVTGGVLTVSAQPEPEPVAWVDSLKRARPECVTDFKYLSVAQIRQGEQHNYIPLYTAPPTKENQCSNNT